MEHPVREITGVLTALATGSPQEQEDMLKNYFLSEASFVHPFCRVPSIAKGSVPFASKIDSQWVLLGLCRWARTLSPKVDIAVDSAVLDPRSSRLYVSIRQTVAFWFIPFHKAHVRLLSVFQLDQRTSWSSDETSKGNQGEGRELAALAGPGQERAKYFIASQEDLYQMNDCLQYFMPGLGPTLWYMVQLLASCLSVVASLILLPLYLLLNRAAAVKPQSQQ